MADCQKLHADDLPWQELTGKLQDILRVSQEAQATREPDDWMPTAVNLAPSLTATSRIVPYRGNRHDIWIYNDSSNDVILYNKPFDYIAGLAFYNGRSESSQNHSFVILASDTDIRVRTHGPFWGYNVGSTVANLQVIETLYAVVRF